MAAGEENVKHLEDCSVSKFDGWRWWGEFEKESNRIMAVALGTWVFSVAGALLAIPVGIKRKSLAPLVFFGTTGTMLDIIIGISQCEREHAERQLKLLEEKNASVAGALTETVDES
ncbi:hypothetical protein RHSIM_RhsimUnG0054200 [Rhododendron simsii]|uniref:Transmembrane protein n=1 Tax=Rhododendron simsii TaxID=118357 RepID=A0A834L4V9_RHOSS|nr:hypothetical protein RHSIM_RhsimUnG0054200 [Rhododendron simsii]